MTRVFRISIVGKYLSQLTVNTFDYVAGTDVPAQAGILSLVQRLGFTDPNNVTVSTFDPNALGGAWQGWTSDIFKFLSIYAYTPYDLAGLYDAPFPDTTVGLKATSPGGATPSFLALQYRSTRNKRGIRRGFKRFAGVDETELTGNSFDPGVADVERNFLGNKLGHVYTVDVDGSSVLFSPAVLKTYLPDNGGRTKSGYSLNIDEATEISDSMTGMQYEADPSPTTQSSRKPGRGI